MTTCASHHFESCCSVTVLWRRLGRLPPTKLCVCGTVRSKTQDRYGMVSFSTIYPFRLYRHREAQRDESRVPVARLPFQRFHDSMQTADGRGLLEGFVPPSLPFGPDDPQSHDTEPKRSPQRRRVR